MLLNNALKPEIRAVQNISITFFRTRGKTRTAAAIRALEAVDDPAVPPTDARRRYPA
jgi:hypothetical protein